MDCREQWLPVWWLNVHAAFMNLQGPARVEMGQRSKRIAKAAAASRAATAAAVAGSGTADGGAGAAVAAAARGGVSSTARALAGAKKQKLDAAGEWP